MCKTITCSDLDEEKGWEGDDSFHYYLIIFLSPAFVQSSAESSRERNDQRRREEGGGARASWAPKIPRRREGRNSETESMIQINDTAEVLKKKEIPC